jgi:multidrug resistance protein MdtO
MAFYLIHLPKFAMQTSLSIARDRIVGILLGLFMMWLVFDQLWGAPAAVEMKRTFISNLRLLAELAREPLSKELKVATQRGYALHEMINANFDKVRSMADAVLFEFGSSRQQDLALRDRIRQLQPQLRMLFLTRIALWKYRVQLPGFELPKPVAMAQQEFDHHLATTLDGMADRMEGKSSEGSDNFRRSVKSLDQTIRTYYSGKSHEVAAQFGAFLSLSRRIESLTLSLDEEMQRKM